MLAISRAFRTDIPMQRHHLIAPIPATKVASSWVSLKPSHCQSAYCKASEMKLGSLGIEGCVDVIRLDHS